MKRVHLVLAMLLLTLAPASAIPLAGASSHTELDILKAYMGPHDVGTGIQHCARTPTNNVLLGEHFAWHLTGTPPTSFLVFHHDLIHTYETWRSANGHPALVSYSPATAIPAAFAHDPACPPRASGNPGMATPTWATLPGGAAPDPLFGYRKLCDFRNPDELSLSLEGWHNDVHGIINGDMGSPDFAPRDPVFWAWHRFLDDLFHLWENNCDYSPSDPNDPFWRGCYGVYDLGYVEHDHSRYGPTDYPSGPLYGPCRDALYGLGDSPCRYVGGCPYGYPGDSYGGGRDPVEGYIECAYGTGAYYAPPVGYVEPWLYGPVYGGRRCGSAGGGTYGPDPTCTGATDRHSYLPVSTGRLALAYDGNLGDCPKPNTLRAGVLHEDDGLCWNDVRPPPPVCGSLDTGIDQPLYDYDGELEYGHGGVTLFYDSGDGETYGATACYGWPSYGHHAGGIYAQDALGYGPRFTVTSDRARWGEEQNPDCGDGYVEPCDPNPPDPSTSPFPLNVVVDTVNNMLSTLFGPAGAGCNSLDRSYRFPAAAGPSGGAVPFGPGADGTLSVLIEQDVDAPRAATAGSVWTA